MEEKQQTSNEYGISQELLVLSELVNYGTVSIPYGNSARYDCILDIEGDIYKIQIKSLNILENGTTINIPMRNSRMSAKGIVKKEYLLEEIDFIAFSYNYKVYLIPAESAKSAFSITLKKPVNSQQHFIDDYEIHKILNIDLKTWTELKQQRRKEKKGDKYFCPDCGTEVSEKGRRCITCASLLKRTGERPTREELKDLIRNVPFKKIGEKYNVTDNAIRKWCRKENLPFRVRDIKQITDEDWRLI